MDMDEQALASDREGGWAVGSGARALLPVHHGRPGRPSWVLLRSLLFEGLVLAFG